MGVPERRPLAPAKNHEIGWFFEDLPFLRIDIQGIKCLKSFLAMYSRFC